MKKQKLWIYEAREENFLPLTYTRAVFELVCGVKSFWKRLWEQFERVEVGLFVRDYLADIVRERTGVEVNEGGGGGEEVIVLDGGLLLEDAAVERVREARAPAVFLLDGEIVGAKIWLEEPFKVQGVGAVRDMVEKMGKEREAEKVEISGKLIKFLWQCVEENGNMIKRDFEELDFAQGARKLSGSVEVVGEKELVYVGEDCEIQPEVFTDTREGPVIIDRNVKVKAFSSIEGPVYIGEGTIVARAQIHGGTTIGPVCRIGGEVAESIFLGYSNKVHAGFIGHSVIGEWVNIGAMSTNSNLKDTYGPVRVKFGGEKIEAGLKVGCLGASWEIMQNSL